MTQNLAYTKFMFDENESLGTKLTRADDSEIAYIVWLHLKNLDKIKHKTVYLPFCPESGKADASQFIGYFSERLPYNSKPVKKFVIELIKKITFAILETQSFL